MEPVKIGKLIRQLRNEQKLTQVQLAERMNISDKTVSKWERGLGCPDLSLLPELSQIFGVDIEKLLSGELKTNAVLSGNMKRMRFYYCPVCGNFVAAIADTAISCCGKRLVGLEMQKASEEQYLTVDRSDQECYITSGHEMLKEHYITMVGLLTGDSLYLRKLYPEWALQVRFPKFVHGKLLWLCSRHGLFYQDI